MSPSFAIEEFKKQGIDIDVVWDAPPQANIDDQNQRIEAVIGRRRAMLETAVEYMRRLTIRAQTPRTSLKNLSDGNQQKTILARWLLSKCRILILDEPTRGIDVNAKFEIQTLLRELAEHGLSMISISSEMQEILEVSDRILVMHEGRVKGVVETSTAAQEILLGLAMA